ncbi:Triosephosphate isomerase [Roseivivax sp. THAF40]|uniref:triose-phosphate isomerase n=1 Tax=unclassified Roseivivax TaxID=2639302 RepID=UPI00126859A9|nr:MULTISPECIES: triose-phosphate isomerase [unclassified Roseivivax]QFS82229.1 Triosephosphate isomerase [Roseivivax sp. THAF197b]QFT46029.1 Triosephosphate isomerase [Roseivivax sp. THAF40]
MTRKIAAGNWKMNGTGESLAELETLAARTGDSAEVVICPPATLIDRAAAKAGPVAIGGQDCHSAASGAHTGDVSAEMLRDAGATFVITGHSERRADHHESDADVAAKTKAAWDAGLTVILCVGESLAQREAGETLDIVGAQLAGSVPEGATADNLIVAYEPIWAIGTGKVPTLEEIGEVHAFMRKTLSDRFATGGDMALLYGGSVKPGNAAEIFAVAEVNGALVGGASLKAGDFGGIIDALNAAS